MYLPLNNPSQDLHNVRLPNRPSTSRLHSQDEINRFTQKSTGQTWRPTHRCGAPAKAGPDREGPRTSWCADGMASGSDSSAGAVGMRGGLLGEVGKEVRLGASLDLCRLQLPCSDFQLHPPPRTLRGKRENNF